jgi:hypothetical protein
MKKILAFVFVILAGLMLAPFGAVSTENMMPTQMAHSGDFERMKALVGAWEGKVDMGKGMESLKVTYELTSAGNAILERFAAGQPHEMVTVYHDRSGKLGMTHYCSLGNQPHMDLTNPGESTMKFVLSEKNPGLASLNETHMHALTITVDDKNSISQTWTLYDKGVKKSDVSVKLVRTKM